MNIKQWVVAVACAGVMGATYAVDDAFWREVRNNKSGPVTQYLSQGVDPNVKSREEQPAIMWAIQNEAWRVYEVLRQHRAFDPNVANGMDETPLMYLAIMGEQERAQALIDQGAKINRLGWSPLHYAASKGQEALVQMLLDQGALVNAPAPDGTTPLMMAARSGSTKTVNTLLAHGADPTALNLAKLSAADWAEANKEPRLGGRLREVAAAYAEQRAQNPDELKPILIGDVPSTASTSESAPVGGSSQYFDLKRFE